MNEEILDKIDQFGHRYLAINCNSHYEALSRDFDLPDIPYNKTHCIFDYDTGEVKLFTTAEKSKRSKNGSQLWVDPWKHTFSIDNKADLSFLDPYKVDKSYFYQIDKVKPQGEIIQMYGIDHIWLACIYKSSIKRMIINQQLFGKYQIIGTREFNLTKLLQD